MRTFLKGLGLGAALMYYYDPGLGRRRRSLLRDQIERTRHETTDFFDKATRDLNNRLTGLRCELESLVTHDTPSDSKLVDRVRSKMGRYVSHPSSIDVSAEQGRVVISGHVLANEVQPLISAISMVRGVEGVENRLEVHDRAENSPGLQGGKPLAERRLLRPNLPPATRLTLGAAGLGLMGYCMLRQSVASSLLGTLGLGLMWRAGEMRETTERFRPHFEQSAASSQPQQQPTASTMGEAPRL